MGKHIHSQEHPLKAPPHSGSSPVGGREDRTSSAATASPKPGAQPAAVVTEKEAVRSPEITDEQIASRAYELWLERCRPEGQDIEHWLEAERQLRDQLCSPHACTAPLVPGP